MVKKKDVKMTKEHLTFVCDYCEMEFDYIPYAIVEFYNGLNKVICNAGCCKEFLKEEWEIMNEEISKEVLMTPEFIAFMGILEKRTDFKEILDTAKIEVEGARNTLDSCSAMTINTVEKALKN
jgi:hypothetical protein